MIQYYFNIQFVIPQESQKTSLSFLIISTSGLSFRRNLKKQVYNLVLFQHLVCHSVGISKNKFIIQYYFIIWFVIPQESQKTSLQFSIISASSLSVRRNLKNQVYHFLLFQHNVCHSVGISKNKFIIQYYFIIQFVIPQESQKTSLRFIIISFRFLRNDNFVEKVYGKVLTKNHPIAENRNRCV